MEVFKSPDTIEIERLRRVQPIIARMGQSVGFVWNQWSSEVRGAIMEMVGGSFSLDDLVVDWATEFDKVWEEREAIIEAKDLPGGDDYINQLSAFVDGKIHGLMAEARLTQ